MARTAPGPRSTGDAKLVELLDCLGEGVILIDQDGRLCHANAAALALNGVAGFTALGGDGCDQADFTLCDAEGQALTHEQAPIPRLLAGDLFRDLVVGLVAEDGASPVRFLEVNGHRLENGAGDPATMALILRDITPEREADARFESAFALDPAPSAILRLADLRYVRINQGFLTLTGFDQDQVLGASFYEIDLFHGAEERDDAKACLVDGRAIAPLEAELMRADNRPNRVIVAGHPIDLAGERCMLFAMTDLEPSRQAQQALDRGAARFAAMFQLVPVAVAITEGADFRLRDGNQAFQRLTGWNEEPARGSSMAKLQIWQDPDFAEMFAAGLEDPANEPCLETMLQRPEGSLVECQVSAALLPAEPDGESSHLWVIQDIRERRREERDIIAAIEETMRDPEGFGRAVVEKLANLRAPPGMVPVELRELTRREKQVLDLLCDGADDAAMAQEMGITRNTLRNHIARVYSKIGVNRRAQAVLWARERGFPLNRSAR